MFTNTQIRLITIYPAVPCNISFLPIVITCMRVSLSLLLLVCTLPVAAQTETLYFGTVTHKGKSSQARFTWRSQDSMLIYASYGLTPLPFQNVTWNATSLSMQWPRNGLTYSCQLNRIAGAFAYKGICSIPGDTMQVMLRQFDPEDARLQGNSLRPSPEDLKILDRTLQLLNNGTNWDSTDNRICDRSEYPYKWSLFCALHQASIDVAGEYRHLSPAIKAVRKAIEQQKPGVQYAHFLQDFNNQCKTFREIRVVLESATASLQKEMAGF